MLARGESATDAVDVPIVAGAPFAIGKAVDRSRPRAFARPSAVAVVLAREEALPTEIRDPLARGGA